jgi:hypothetical protein
MTDVPLIACASIVASPAMGVCRTSDDLRAILRARFTELGVSFETVDNVAGLPQRYTAKVLGLQPTRNFGQISLDGTAGIMLIAVQDAEPWIGYVIGWCLWSASTTAPLHGAGLSSS